jgi:hypothetical protein
MVPDAVAEPPSERSVFGEPARRVVRERSVFGEPARRVTRNARLTRGGGPARCGEARPYP